MVFFLIHAPITITIYNTFHFNTIYTDPYKTLFWFEKYLNRFFHLEFSHYYDYDYAIFLSMNMCDVPNLYYLYTLCAYSRIKFFPFFFLFMHKLLIWWNANDSTDEWISKNMVLCGTVLCVACWWWFVV